MAEEIKKPIDMEQNEAQGAETAGETNAPRGRAALLLRYKEKYPDRNWDEEGDDAMYDQAMSDYDAQGEELGKYKERDKNLEDLFAKNPQSAAFLMDMAEGGEDDAIERIYKNFGEDIVAAMEDPDEREKLKAIRKKKQEDLDKAAEEAKQWEENMQESVQRLEALKADKNLDDATVEQMLNMIDQVTNDFDHGQITDDTYNIFLKAIGYDSDVEKAKVSGERNGRNARIDEGMRRRKAENTGVPMVGGSAGNAGSRPMSRRGNSMGNTGSAIWAAGNMKRTNYE